MSQTFASPHALSHAKLSSPRGAGELREHGDDTVLQPSRGLRYAANRRRAVAVRAAAGTQPVASGALPLSLSLSALSLSLLSLSLSASLFFSDSSNRCTPGTRSTTACSPAGRTARSISGTSPLRRAYFRWCRPSTSRRPSLPCWLIRRTGESSARARLCTATPQTLLSPIRTRRCSAAR